MRLFFAVPPSSSTRAALDTALAPTRAALEGEPIAWEPAHRLHVTLKFLGEVDPSRVEALIAAAAPIVARHAPFAIEVAGLSAFPDASAPRVLWLGAATGAEPLAALAADLDEAIAGVGCARDERPYVPHLTCARARSTAGERALGALLAAGHSVPRTALAVTAVTLFESRAGAHHPLHELGMQLGLQLGLRR
ncbi:MAG: hypothetical protein NVS3B10_02510 [Polyangiales bacterium]